MKRIVFHLLTTAATALCMQSLLGCATTVSSTPALAPQIRIAGDHTPTAERDLPPVVVENTISRLADNKFRASCPDFGAVAVAQRTPVWCWAACAEMVHAYKLSPMTQHEIAARIHGRFTPDLTPEQREETARSAGYEEILLALVPDKEPAEIREASRYLALKLNGGGANFDLRGGAETQARKNLTNSDILIDDLLSGEPVIVGLRNFDSPEALEAAQAKAVQDGTDPAGITFGHVYVVYAAEFGIAKSTFAGKVKGGLDKVRDIFGSSDSSTPELVERIPIDENLKNAEDWAKRVPAKYDLWSVELANPMPADADTSKPDAQPQKETMSAAEFANRVAFMISAREARHIIENQSYLDNERTGR